MKGTPGWGDVGDCVYECVCVRVRVEAGGDCARSTMYLL